MHQTDFSFWLQQFHKSLCYLHSLLLRLQFPYQLHRLPVYIFQYIHEQALQSSLVTPLIILTQTSHVDFSYAP